MVTDIQLMQTGLTRLFIFYFYSSSNIFVVLLIQTIDFSSFLYSFGSEFVRECLELRIVSLSIETLLKKVEKAPFLFFFNIFIPEDL